MKTAAGMAGQNTFGFFRRTGAFFESLVRFHFADLPEPFQAVRKVSELHAFFRDYNLATDPFLQKPGALPGHCYVCDAECDFEVDRPEDGSPVNWRETLKCPGCAMINRWRGCIHLFDAICEPSEDSRIYITEALTPVSHFLKTRHPELSSSEYIEEAEPGEVVEARGQPVRNEDVTRLSFENRSFDAILSFDVLEHVPGYRKALNEFYRVLDYGGYLIWTAPFSFQQETVVRARIGDDGAIEHLMEPCYHGDPLSDEGVLAFYEFGMDLLMELRRIGFKDNCLVCYNSNEWGYPGANVAFVSRKR